MNWLSYAGIGFSILTAIGNVIILLAVKFNDLKHVQKDLEEIRDSIKCIESKLYENMEKVGKLEGKCKANHG
jgi:uncharacterized membrane-anchored protein YhcB (DUF1043 family)